MIIVDHVVIYMTKKKHKKDRQHLQLTLDELFKVKDKNTVNRLY